MAYVEKYLIEFKDIYGPDWSISIQEDAFGGIVTNLIATDSPLIIQHDSDSDAYNEPIRPSKAVFTVYSETEFALTDFYTDEDFRLKVIIKCESDIYWQGFIVSGEYSEPYEQVPYPVTLTAIDGLSYLKNIKYDDEGTYYDFRLKKSQVLLDILDKIQVTTFTEFVNIYENGMNQTVDDSPFDQCSIDVDLFKDKFCYDVLKELLSPYDAVIRQNNSGEIIIYRPIELTQTTIYGRIFTGATTKSSTSITTGQFISRVLNTSDLKQVPGGVMMIQRPAKKINLFQDYGNKESWIDNYKFEANTYQAGSYIFDYWESESCNVLPMSTVPDGGTDGCRISTKNAYPTKDKYIYQQLGTFAITSNDVLKFEFEFYIFNYSGGAILPRTFYIEISSDAGNYWLYYASGNEFAWDVSSNKISQTIINFNEWFTASGIVPGIPEPGPYTIKIFGLDDDEPQVDLCIKNLKFYCTSDELTVKKYKESYFPFVWSKWKKTSTYKDIAEIVQKEWTIDNALNGIELDFDYILGDVTDVALDNVLEQLAGSIALVYHEPQYRVDTVTLTGASGTANVTCSAVTKSAIFDTNPTTTAANFVTDYAADYAAIDITVTSAGADIIFTSDILGAEFSGDTAIVNVIPDLDGTVDLTTASHATAESFEYTDVWNTRDPGGEAAPLLEITATTIGEQYSRPKQLIQMAIQETDTTAPVLNIIDNLQDELNTCNGVIRKFVFNRGSFDVYRRWWDADFVEIIQPSLIYYVSTTGDDDNTGLDQAHPWQTLAYAEANATTPGCVIALKKGDTWAIDNVFEITHGGSAGNYIIWDGSLWGSGANAIIKANSAGGAAPKYYSLSHIAACQYVVVQNITFDEDNLQRDSVIAIGGADGNEGPTNQNNEDYITIQDCAIVNNGDGLGGYNVGIMVRTWNTNMSNITIRRNTVDGANNHCIVIYPGRTDLPGCEDPYETTNVYIGYNTVTNMGKNNDGTYTGIGIFNKITGTIVEHNTITVGTGHGFGIAISQNEPTAGWFPTGIVLRYNDIRMGGEAALRIENGQAQEVTSYYNKYYSLSAAAAEVALSASPAWTGASLKFYNDTMVSDGTYPTFREQTNISGAVTVKNCILYNRSTGGDYSGMCLQVSTATDIVHNNNSYYKTENTYRRVLANATYYTPATTQSTWEVSSIIADPALTDISGFDWTLQAGSPCINTGVHIAGIPEFDFAGLAIDPTTPNIGCHENI